MWVVCALFNPCSASHLKPARTICARQKNGVTESITHLTMKMNLVKVSAYIQSPSNFFRMAQAGVSRAGHGAWRHAGVQFLLPGACLLK